MLIGLPSKLACDCLFRFEALRYGGLSLGNLFVPSLLVECGFLHVLVIHNIADVIRGKILRTIDMLN